MKKIGLFSAAVFFLLLSSFYVVAQAKDSAQGKVDYFPGKWNVLVKGVPGGDAKMTVNFERKDTALTATLLDSTGKQAGTVNKVIENEQSVTVYFTAQGYDVDLTLEKKDDDHVVGSLMNMFDATGDRIRDLKSK